MIEFLGVDVTGVKADLAKGRMKLTFEIEMDQQSAAEELAFYVKKEGGLTLRVSPNQLSFAQYVKPAPKKKSPIKKDPETGEVTEEGENENDG